MTPYNIIRKLNKFSYTLLLRLGIISHMRIHGSDIFKANPNGTFFISKPIRMGGVSMSNTVFSPGVRIGDFDLAVLATRDLEVELENGVYVITGYYE